jgi:hypothetical protein
MSDYFLNKIYDSLLVNKAPKAKSTFRTLSESYDLVYEDENTETTNQAASPTAAPSASAPATPSASAPAADQTEQGSVNVQEPFVGARLKPPFKDVEPRKQEWTQVQQDLYELTTNKKGYGPGEWAVASVISGYTDVPSCSALASGGNLSYDVAFPSQKTPTFKFEVKKIEGNGTVFIAKHGTLIARKIQKDTEDIIQTILNEYNDLSEDGKAAVDDKLLSYVNAEVGEKPTAKKKMGRYSRAVALKNLKENKQWTVKKWCESILADIGEIPFNSILFKSVPKSGYDFPDIKRTSPEDFTTKMYVLFSVEDFIIIVNNIMQNEKDSSIPEPTKERRAGLAKTFKQYYGNEEGTSPELHNKLDAEAANVDKKLTSLKIQTLKTGYGDFNTFVRELKNAGLSKKLGELKEYIDKPETVKSAFPKDLTGLFVVDSEGYHYFPKDDIPTYIKITTVTTGGIKIGFK